VSKVKKAPKFFVALSKRELLQGVAQELSSNVSIISKKKFFVIIIFEKYLIIDLFEDESRESTTSPSRINLLSNITSCQINNKNILSYFKPIVVRVS